MINIMQLEFDYYSCTQLILYVSSVEIEPNSHTLVYHLNALLYQCTHVSIFRTSVNL